MGELSPIHTGVLRRDLHGETVGIIHTTPILSCDYCNAIIDTTEPILYEAIRVANLPTLETHLDPPKGWMLDAARCQDCTISHLSPTTIGYEEALVLLRVTDADGILSTDASTLKVVNLSPSNDGYVPPQVGTHILAASDDVGSARWLRMCARIDRVNTASLESPVAMEQLSALISRSNDVPPGINI